MNSLFGVELPTPVNFIIAFVVVLALIGAATWLIRRFGATRLDAAARGRQPRLAVIDQAAVDGRRKLVIVRRDNVEHLLMIGGPNDVVVESAIVRGGAQPAREPTATRAIAEALPRAVPLPDATTWPLQPEPAPAAPPVRVERERPRAEEPAQWPSQPAPPVAPATEPPPPRAQRVDPLAGLAAELAKPAEAPRAEPRVEPRVEPRAKPAPAPTPVIDPAAAAAADKNLAEMAQRLEIALRQPGAAPAAPQPEPKAPPAKPAPEAKRADPKTAPRPEAKPAPRQEPAPAVAAAAPAKPALDSLEQEMANLLGRPGKT